MSFSTEQEEFWAGAFGDSYVERCRGADLSAARAALWSRMLQRCGAIGSVTEFGANIGLNMIALRQLLPNARLDAVEINAAAVAELRTVDGVVAHQGSFLDTVPEAPADLAFTCTVLIHINPDMLERAYARLAAASQRYVVICEYYNPTPVTVTYRGHGERLFKRDFAGEFMSAHPAFGLVDYGFQYHRDPNWPVDDFTWFLMERR